MKKSPSNDSVKEADPVDAKDLTTEASRYAALRNHRIRFEDAIDPNAERVSDLRKNDILFGRGKGFQNHHGNQRMRKIIEKYKVQYHSLKRSEKQVLIESVYKELTEEGARFLKKVEGEDAWVRVDRPIALQKVSHTLRCRKSIEKGMGNDQGKIPKQPIPGTDQFLVRDQAALHGMIPTPVLGMAPGPYGSLAGLEAQRLTNYESLVGLEAQRLAALNRYRALSGMPPAGAPGAMLAFTPGLDQLNMMRKEQLLGGLMLSQQQPGMNGMGLACVDPSLRAGNVGPSAPEAATPAPIVADS